MDVIIFVFTALATLPLRQGEYLQGEGVDTMFTFAYSPFQCVLIHPLRFARPPVSGGQSAGAVCFSLCPPWGTLLP